MSNSFDLADRYMIVHFGGLDPRAALDLVGQYHSARVMPVLFLGLADMLSTWITPHLIGDWEAGRREAVGARLKFILKLFLLAFLGISIGMLICAALLPHGAGRQVRLRSGDFPLDAGLRLVDRFGHD
ncbi:MAG: hypothetical protein QM775_35565 [Pirellulales bacterium]